MTTVAHSEKQKGSVGLLIAPQPSACILVFAQVDYILESLGKVLGGAPSYECSLTCWGGMACPI